MYSVRGDTVNDVFRDALWLMKASGVESDSRNGKVKLLPEPCCLTYLYPVKRVLFAEARDANPYFHLMEALWMLAGRNDVKWLKQFNSKIDQYSDDGVSFHGAYGYRWVNHFDFDQLDWLIQHLTLNPDSRRAVLTMWDPRVDTPDKTNVKDVPCNTQACFSIRPHGLDMTVFNRSNDLVWGATGANAVHFSFLQEYLAWALGVPVGRYHQITNNLHIYEPHWWMLEECSILFKEEGYKSDPFQLGTQVGNSWLFHNELKRFLERSTHQLTDLYTIPFLNEVAKPMAVSWFARKQGLGTGLPALKYMVDCDWKVACTEWIQRREQGKERDDGNLKQSGRVRSSRKPR